MSTYYQPVPETVHVELRCAEHRMAVEIGCHAPPERIGLAFRDLLIEHATCNVTGHTWDENRKWPAPAPRVVDEEDYVNRIEARIGPHGRHFDWCHLCGRRSTQTADVDYPHNAENGVQDPWTYVRICADCALRIHRAATEDVAATREPRAAERVEESREPMRSSPGAVEQAKETN